MRAAMDRLAQNGVGTVVSVAGEDMLTVRLLDMGFTRGARVRAVGAPGDPMRVRLRGVTLSLRKSEAARVLVEAEAGAWGM